MRHFRHVDMYFAQRQKVRVSLVELEFYEPFFSNINLD